ncbi:MAG: hypothetical protein C6P35_03280 [Cohnella sp.]|uniref:hypothetical protein n=1 Tax=Cohnella sp. TaxID=1883426 RepID=UPI000E3B1FC5|nr:hypothetical protein [Cohnella sp.]REK68005.1 MAG: hypothetical protein C6P35_03280 [Cohnella sp.]
MATEIGELRARLVAEATQIKQEIKAVKKELTDLGDEGKKTSRAFVDLSGVMEKIGANTDQLKKIEAVLRNIDPSRLEKSLEAIVEELRRMGVESKQIQKVEVELKQVATEAQKTEESVKGVHNSMEGLGSAIATIGAGATFAKLTTTVKTLADEAQRLAMSYSGLSEVSKALNIDVEKSADLVDELADRWGLNKAVMADTVKTYLTAGLTLDQTRDIIIATADAAVYNREAHLQWDEAIRQVAQGIKMGNSELTDAAGITTNLSVMYDRYAKSIGTTAAKLTDAQKIQAAYNGIMQESAIFAGNADSAMTGYTGTQATFNQTLQTARVELGEAFLPVLEDLMETVTPLIRQFASFADGNKEVVAGVVAATTAFTAFIAVVGALATAFTVLKAAMGGWMTIITLIGAAAGGIWAYQQAADAAAESVWKFAKNQDELNQKLSESPLNRSAEEVKKLQEDIDTLNGLLDKRKSLQEELNKLNDERNAKLISNESGAEILKLDRQISDLKENLAEVDKQLSQLGINTPEDAPKVLQKMNDQLNASIPALMKLEEANLREAAAQIKHIDSVNQLVKQYEKLDKQTKLTVDQKNQLTQVVKQLQQEYPGLQTQLDAEGRWHIRNTDLIYNLIDAEKASVNEATAASKKRLEAWRAETEAKLKLAKQQVQALMAVAEADFSETKIGSKLPAGLSKALDFVGDIAARGLAAKAQQNVNQYQLTINEIDKQIAAITSGTLDKYFDTSASTGAAGDDKKKKSQKKDKTLVEIQEEQYQQALKYMQYKKDLNQMSEKDELAYLARLEQRYKNNGEIRRDIEVKIYQLKQQMAEDEKKRREEQAKEEEKAAKARFEASAEWIEQEERRMTLAGESEEKIARMKLDAWTRVRNRYAKDSDFYKQADTQVYNLKVSLIKMAQKAEEEAAKEREKRIKDVTDSTLKAIEKQKKAELDALDERRKEIQKFYDDQLKSIDDSERLKKRNDLIAEMEKYRYATSEKGQKHFLELQEKLRQMDIEDQKDALEEERDQRLEELDKQKNDIETWYDDLREATSDFTGDLTALYKLADDERLKSFVTTNEKIKAEMATLQRELASYASYMPSVTAPSSSSGSVAGIGTGASAINTAAVIAQMQANSAAWKTASASERARLEAENKALGASLGAAFDPKTGRWTKSDGTPLYHTGRDGVTGLNFRSPYELMPDEINAIIKNNEYVFTPEQVKSLVSATSTGATINIEKFMEVNDPVFEDNIDLRAFGRETGNEAAEILRKQLTGGG